MGNAAGVGVGGSSANEAGNAAGGMSSTNGGETTQGGVANVGGAAGGAGGAPDLCEGKDLNCPDDGNPCTEDECNPATGECGIPRTDTDCDDNIYCNGTDLCDAGKCTVHSGNPCLTHTCDEPGKSCQCAGKEDCSADQPGDWSDCVYPSECATTGEQTRPVTSYTCNVGTGKCEGKPTIEKMACTRETQGIACTSDNLRCDGDETCNAGKCTPSKVNPCVGNAAGNYCSEGSAECGVCSGNAVQGAYPGCSSGQFCCYNHSVASAWACENAKCPIVIKTIVSSSIISSSKISTIAPL